MDEVGRERFCGVGSGREQGGGGGESGGDLGLGESSLVGEEELVGTLVSVSGLALRGVLKGDLKGWESVWDAASMRRRLEGRIGDMVAAGPRLTRERQSSSIETVEWRRSCSKAGSQSSLVLGLPPLDSDVIGSCISI